MTQFARQYEVNELLHGFSSVSRSDLLFTADASRYGLIKERIIVKQSPMVLHEVTHVHESLLSHSVPDGSHHNALDQLVYQSAAHDLHEKRDQTDIVRSRHHSPAKDSMAKILGPVESVSSPQQQSLEASISSENDELESATPVDKSKDEDYPRARVAELSRITLAQNARAVHEYDESSTMESSQNESSDTPSAVSFQPRTYDGKPSPYTQTDQHTLWDNPDASQSSRSQSIEVDAFPTFASPKCCIAARHITHNGWGAGQEADPRNWADVVPQGLLKEDNSKVGLRPARSDTWDSKVEFEDQSYIAIDDGPTEEEVKEFIEEWRSSAELDPHTIEKFEKDNEREVSLSGVADAQIPLTASMARSRGPQECFGSRYAILKPILGL